MNSDNLRIFNALKAIADKLGADDKSNVSENEVGKIAEELERIAMIEDLKPEPGGGGGGSLSELSDTEITSPSDNDILTYDATAEKWKNAAGGSGGGLVVPTFTATMEGNDTTTATATCDMTYAEIAAAVRNKQCIIARLIFAGEEALTTDQYLGLVEFIEEENDGGIRFNKVTIDQTGVFQIMISAYSDGNVNIDIVMYPSN